MAVKESFYRPNILEVIGVIEVGRSLFPNMGLVARQAVEDILSGQFASPHINTIGYTLTISPEVLLMRPVALIRQAEIWQAVHIARGSGVLGSGQINSLRVIGANAPEIELHYLYECGILPDSLNSVCQYLGPLSDTYTCNHVLQERLNHFRDRKGQVPDEALQLFPAVSIFPSAFTLVSDPLFDPARMNLSPNQSMQREQWTSLLRVLPELRGTPFSTEELKKALRLKVLKHMPLCYASAGVASHWGKFQDVRTGSESGVLTTMDSVQDLAVLNSPVDGVVMNQMDPGILLKDPDASISRNYEAFQEWLSQFGLTVLSQVRPGGFIFVTFGRGNDKSEARDRGLAYEALAALLTKMNISAYKVRNNPLQSISPAVRLFLPNRMTFNQAELIRVGSSYALIAAALPQDFSMDGYLESSAEISRKEWQQLIQRAGFLPRDAFE